MDSAGLCAKDLMQRDVKTVSEKTSLREAAKIMYEGKLSSLVVERNDKGDAFGILTRKDVVAGLFALETDDMPLLVEDVMTKPAITLNPVLSIDHCLQMMRMVGVRRMPVVEANELVGIVSNTDVFRHLVESAGLTNEADG